MEAGNAARVTNLTLNEVSTARMKTGSFQSQFARALNLSPITLQRWEQGSRKPSGASQALIETALRHLEIFKEALKL